MNYTIRYIENIPSRGDYEMHLVGVSTIKHEKKYKVKVTGTVLGLLHAVSGVQYAVSAALSADQNKVPSSQYISDDTILVDSNWQPLIIKDFGDGTAENFCVDSDGASVGFKIH